MEISNKNIEQLIFQMKEGLLDDKEYHCVEQALNSNKEWKELADLYDPLLQVKQYPKLEYAGKDKLRAIADTSKKHGIIIPLWSRVAAACAIVAFVILILRINNGTHNNDKIVASNYNETPDSIHEFPTPITTQETRQTATANTINNTNNKTELIASNHELESKESNECIYTNRLITYISDNDTAYDYILLDNTLSDEQQILFSLAKPAVNKTIYTNSLIYYEDEAPFINNTAPYVPQPVWRAAIDDWFSNLQLARIELQTNAVNSLYKIVNNY